MTIIGMALIAAGILMIYNGYIGQGKWYDPIKYALGGGTSGTSTPASGTSGTSTSGSTSGTSTPVTVTPSDSNQGATRSNNR